MNFAKRLLMVFGAASLAGILGVILTPRVAHAVATLVDVARNEENPARQHVLIQADFILHAGDPSGQTSFVVPAGKTLVVENFSARSFAPDCPVSFYQIGPPLSPSFNAEWVPGGSTAGVSQVVNQPLVFYADQDTTVFVAALLTSPAANTCQMITTLVGHYVTVP